MASSDDFNKQRSGMLLDEDFDVFGDHKIADEEMSNEALKEISSPNDQEVKESPPTLPVRTSSHQQSPVPATPESPPTGVMTMEQIQKEYADIANHKIFQLAGDDLTGRPVIAFSMGHLPNRNLIDHQRLFKFLKSVMEQYVENDYTIVYFHYGLNRQNKPSLKWLLQVYRELDRKYKKNLKALFIVHPSNFIKIVFNMFYPFISKKFGRKINNISRLDELAPHIRLDQLDIPKVVRDHDEQIATKLKPLATSASIFHTPLVQPRTQQFAVHLKKLKENSGEALPIVVCSIVQFIEEHALDVEGIFRRSAQVNIVNSTVERFNRGEKVEFSVDDMHLAPVLLKKFLRDLPEPLLTFEIYDNVMDACSLPEEQRLTFTQQMIFALPEENRAVIIYLLKFLEKVVEHSSANRMTSTSLAIVFGPNILWSQSQASTLASMSKINTYCKYLIDNSSLILEKSSA